LRLAERCGFEGRLLHSFFLPFGSCWVVIRRIFFFHPAGLVFSGFIGLFDGFWEYQ